LSPAKVTPRKGLLASSFFSRSASPSAFLASSPSERRASPSHAPPAAPTSPAFSDAPPRAIRNTPTSAPPRPPLSFPPSPALLLPGVVSHLPEQLLRLLPRLDPAAAQHHPFEQQRRRVGPVRPLAHLLRALQVPGRQHPAGRRLLVLGSSPLLAPVLLPSLHV